MRKKGTINMETKKNKKVRKVKRKMKKERKKTMIKIRIPVTFSRIIPKTQQLPG